MPVGTIGVYAHKTQPMTRPGQDAGTEERQQLCPLCEQSYPVLYSRNLDYVLDPGCPCLRMTGPEPQPEQSDLSTKRAEAGRLGAMRRWMSKPTEGGE